MPSIKEENLLLKLGDIEDDLGTVDERITALESGGSTHTHPNKAIIDAIIDAGSGSIITDAERDKLQDIENVRIVAKSGGQYTNIQDAIDVAVDGDVVIIYPGTYIENIVLKDGVTLRGTCAKSCTINGTVTYNGTSMTTLSYLGVDIINNSCIVCTGVGKLNIIKCRLVSSWTNGTGQTVNSAKCIIDVSNGNLNIGSNSYLSISTSGDDISEHNTCAYWVHGSNKVSLSSFNVDHDIKSTDDHQNIEVMFNTNTNSDTEIIIKNGKIYLQGIVHSQNYIAPFYNYVGAGFALIDGNLLTMKDSGHCYTSFNYNGSTSVLFCNNVLMPENISDKYLSFVVGSSYINCNNNSWDEDTMPGISGNVTHITTLSDGSIVSNGKLNIGDSTEITSILDEDDLISNSNTALATQQSIKSYVDSLLSSAGADNIKFVSNSVELDNAIIELRALGGGIIQLLNDISYAPATNRDITNIKIIGGTNTISMTKLTFTNANYLYGDYYEIETIGIDPYSTNAPFRVSGTNVAFIKACRIHHRGGPTEYAFDFADTPVYMWIEEAVSLKMKGSAGTVAYIYNQSNVTMVGGTANADSSSTVSGASSLTRVDVHNNLTGLNDGDYQHLTASQLTTLTTGVNADSLHTHSGGGSEVLRQLTLYVDNNGDDLTGTGSSNNPYKTIQKALDIIGSPTDIASASTHWVINITSGVYDEDLIIPPGRILSLITDGTVVLGDGLDPTNTRSITLQNSSVFEFGGFRPTFSIKAISSTETTSTHVARSGMFYITGDFIRTELTGSTISTHDVIFYGVKLDGDYTSIDGGMTLGQNSLYLYKSKIGGTILQSAPTSGAIHLQRALDCEFDGEISVNKIGLIRHSEFDGNITVVNLPSTDLPPNGFFGCDFGGKVFTGPANSFKIDASCSNLPSLVTATIDTIDNSDNIYYDNSISGLTATKVKTAIDELAASSGGGLYDEIWSLTNNTDGNPPGTRGDNAVDLQSLRAVNTEIASGVTSNILGGESNTATHPFSSIINGNTNIVGGSYSSIINGLNNDINSDYNLVTGGNNNLINSSVGSSILGTKSENEIISSGNSSIINSFRCVITEGISVGSSENTMLGCIDSTLTDNNHVFASGQNIVSTDVNKSFIFGDNSTVEYMTYSAIFNLTNTAQTYSSMNYGFFVSIQDGNFYIKNETGTYGLGTTNSGNSVAMKIDDTGRVFRDSSSLRYKDNVKPLQFDTTNIYNLEPKSFNLIGSDSDDFGLIAEEVDAWMPELVVRDREGKPDAIKYDKVAIVLLNEVKKLKQEVDKLKGE